MFCKADEIVSESEIVSREAREKLNKPSHLEKCKKMGIIPFKQENLASMHSENRGKYGKYY